ncbi:glycosyl hydrolase [Nonomuraea sp. NPDC046570]|uniref:glycoside hydrolase family 26 protein n=1 Tax=Nonomuraea sp. NPDC046570 TaxID=3155255 RepID=UPI0033CEF1C2
MAVAILALGVLTGLPACSKAAGTAAPRAEAPEAAKVDGLLGLAESPACQVTAKLIPACGAWWGVAPEIFTGLGPVQALQNAERRMRRTADIMHVYHRGSELFPNAKEVALARDPSAPRLLLINWKPSFDRTWAEIAAGALDKRIDRLADHIRQTFPERFFLTVHHEPENDVKAGPRSGMTAADYAAMYRHVVLRLRERGVKNAVMVMTYMGAPNWAAEPWFEQLYPGDDVVDWVAMDPYVDDRVRDFDGLINKVRKENTRWPGFYRWMQWRFPGKPVMVAEWGVFDRAAKRDFYLSVRKQIRHYPQIKALVYFDSPRAPRGDTRFDTDTAAGRAFSELARDPHFRATAVPRP